MEGLTTTINVMFAILILSEIIYVFRRFIAYEVKLACKDFTRWSNVKCERILNSLKAIDHVRKLNSLLLELLIIFIWLKVNFWM